MYTGSNHDAGRLTTRWAAATTRRRARLALLMLLTLRGTPFLYYGDELGAARRADSTRRTALDPVPGAPATRRATATAAGRRCRGRAEPGGGFTDRTATPWLPFGDLAALNVAAQRATPARSCTSRAT